jgi:hypothetical protein
MPGEGEPDRERQGTCRAPLSQLINGRHNPPDASRHRETAKLCSSRSLPLAAPVGLTAAAELGVSGVDQRNAVPKLAKADSPRRVIDQMPGFPFGEEVHGADATHVQLGGKGRGASLALSGRRV